MEKNIQILKERIQQCNLSEEDKKTLIKLLENDEVNLDQFIKTLVLILKASKECFKLFDIDIGD
jgi:adenine specific DNA methylase Mod